MLRGGGSPVYAVEIPGTLNSQVHVTSGRLCLQYLIVNGGHTTWTVLATAEVLKQGLVGPAIGTLRSTPGTNLEIGTG